MRSSSVAVQITTSFTAVDSSNQPVTINELYLLPDCLKNVSYPNPPYTDLQLAIVPVAGPNAKVGDAATQIALGDGNQVFALQWKAGNNSPLVAQVTVANMPVFAADPTVHAQLKTAFTQFKIALETLENQQCLIPGGAQILAQRVAANLPLRFEEILWFYYGYDAGNRMVDLSTMMRLQVQYGNYQYIAPNGFSGNALNGFAGSGQVAYDITVDPKTRALMFNNFMRAFSPPFSIINPPSPNEIANVVDLAAAGALHRHYRLIYPNQFYNTQAIYDDPSVTYNVTLLGADTLSALEAATQQFLPDRDSSGISGASFVFFSGRTSVFPMIPVFLQYNSQGPSQINLVYLPLGTTVDDLFSQTFGATAFDIAAQMKTPSIQLYRYMQPALCSVGSFMPPFGSSQIGFPSVNNPYFVSSTTGMNYLDLPLVAGDKIIFTI